MNDKLESMWKEAGKAAFETLTRDMNRRLGIPIEINTEYLPLTGQDRHTFSQFIRLIDIATGPKNKTLHENCLNTCIVLLTMYGVLT